MNWVYVSEAPQSPHSPSVEAAATALLVLSCVVSITPENATAAVPIGLTAAAEALGPGPSLSLVLIFVNNLPTGPRH